MPEKRADSPASSARFVGRRSRDELDSYEHDSTKHLCQHGFESPEKLCVASADEPSTNPSRSTLCAAKITWKTFHIMSCGAVCALLTGAILHNLQANSRYFSRRPTVCVTCAGAGGGTPSDEKKAEAEKMPEKRADSPASSARWVGRQDWRDALPFKQPTDWEEIPAMSSKPEEQGLELQ
jgi:hypothetical protein